MILKLRFHLGLNTFLIFLHFSLVESVPEDYCLSPLNTSDCGRPPTPVFYYYKPGSRCEIRLWRGCPTENLFNTEYHCSHHCIGKLWSSEQDAKAETISKTSIGLKFQCDVPIDTFQCKQAKKLVYTYDNRNKSCIEVAYYGCPTENKFKDEEECKDKCEKSEDQWEDAVKKMDIDELNKLNDLIDNVKNDIEPEKEDLKKDVKNPKIRPHTISDVDEVTDLPADETNKVDHESEESTEKPEKSTDKPEAPTDKPETPTDKPETLTDKPEETTEGEESETKAETEAPAATTNSAQETPAAAEETTKLPVSTKRTRKRRQTHTPKEGDVVREGFDYNY